MPGGDAVQIEEGGEELTTFVVSMPGSFEEYLREICQTAALNVSQRSRDRGVKVRVVKTPEEDKNEDELHIALAINGNVIEL
jgi:hypothetical protein